MKKIPIRIAFVGPKGIGKDFILSKMTERDTDGTLTIKKYVNLSPEADFLLENYQRMSIGDYLKSLATNKKRFEKAIGNAADFNFEFLKQDLKKVKDLGDDEIIGKIEKYFGEGSFDSVFDAVSTFGSVKFDTISKGVAENIEKDVVRIELALMEIFKNEKQLSTRHHLQIIGDVVKVATGNPFFITESLIKTSDKDKPYVNTDTRTLTDLADLVAGGFVIIKLDSESVLENVKSTCSSDFSKIHFSETDLGLQSSSDFAHISINADGSKIDPKGIKRLTDIEIFEQIGKALNTAVEITKGPHYLRIQKEALNLKKSLTNTDFFKKQEAYLRTYAKFRKGEASELELKEKYKDYDKVRGELLEGYGKAINKIKNNYLIPNIKL